MTDYYTNDRSESDILLNFSKLVLSNKKSSETPNYVFSAKDVSSKPTVGSYILDKLVPEEWEGLSTSEDLKSLIKSANLDDTANFIQNINVLKHQDAFKPLFQQIQSIKLAGAMFDDISNNPNSLIDEFNSRKKPIDTDSIIRVQESYTEIKKGLQEALDLTRVEAKDLVPDSKIEGRFVAFTDKFEFGEDASIESFINQAVEHNLNETSELMKSGKMQQLAEFNKPLSSETIGKSIEHSILVHAAGLLTQAEGIVQLGQAAMKLNTLDKLKDTGESLTTEQKESVSGKFVDVISQLNVHHISNLLGNDVGKAYSERGNELINNFTYSNEFINSVREFREQLFDLSKNFSKDEISSFKSIFKDAYPSDGLTFPAAEFKSAYNSGLETLKLSIENFEAEPPQSPKVKITPSIRIS